MYVAGTEATAMVVSHARSRALAAAVSGAPPGRRVSAARGPGAMAAASAAEVSARRCLAVGPVADSAELERLRRLVDEDELELASPGTLPPPVRRHVLTVALLDGDRHATQRRLEARGFHDVSYLATSPFERHFSAGVFKVLAFAEERRDALRAAGFEALIQPLSGPREWSATLRSPGHGADVAELLGALPTQAVDCPLQPDAAPP